MYNNPFYLSRCKIALIKEAHLGIKCSSKKPQTNKTSLRASTREKDCFDLQRLTQCAMFINNFSKKVSILGGWLSFYLADFKSALYHFLTFLLNRVDEKLPDALVNDRWLILTAIKRFLCSSDDESSSVNAARPRD